MAGMTSAWEIWGWSQRGSWVCRKGGRGPTQEEAILLREGDGERQGVSDPGDNRRIRAKFTSGDDE